MSAGDARRLHLDHARARRSTDRPIDGVQPSSIWTCQTDSYGNAVPMETAKRFPPGLGNPAAAGIPTFPQLIPRPLEDTKTREMTDRTFNKVLPMCPV
jgi:hypothetical protein